jgi:hypothetical protein
MEKPLVGVFQPDRLEGTANPNNCFCGQTHMEFQSRNTKYNENIVLSISRVRCLRWQRSSRTSADGEERDERRGHYRQERRAQCCEGHKKGCSHGGLHVHAIIEATLLNATELFTDSIRLSLRPIRQ